MGRPMKPSYVGCPTDYTDGRKVIMFNNAWIPGASAVSTKPVYIIKQTGATRYLVSDGTITGEVYLVDTITGEGQGDVRVVYGTNSDYFFHASKILLHRVDTFQDVSLAWTFDGVNQITCMDASEYTSALNPTTKTTTSNTSSTPTTSGTTTTSTSTTSDTSSSTSTTSEGTTTSSDT